MDSLSKLFKKHLSSYQHNIDPIHHLSEVIVQVTEESSIKLSSAPEYTFSNKLNADSYPLVQHLMRSINEIYLPINRNKRGSGQGSNGITLSAVLSYPAMKLTAIVDNEDYSILGLGYCDIIFQERNPEIEQQFR